MKRLLGMLLALCMALSVTGGFAEVSYKSAPSPGGLGNISYVEAGRLDDDSIVAYYEGLTTDDLYDLVDALVCYGFYTHLVQTENVAYLEAVSIRDGRPNVQIIPLENDIYAVLYSANVAPLLPEIDQTAKASIQARMDRFTQPVKLPAKATGNVMFQAYHVLQKNYNTAVQMSDPVLGQLCWTELYTLNADEFSLLEAYFAMAFMMGYDIRLNSENVFDAAFREKYNLPDSADSHVYNIVVQNETDNIINVSVNVVSGSVSVAYNPSVSFYLLSQDEFSAMLSSLK